MKNLHVEDVADQLDAAVMNGDFLADNEDRNEFRDLLARWGRAVDSWQEVSAGDS